ncbi:hypothetical protein BB381_04335 [Campylobacter pinnipediorum subsp. caledonicus]|uniref:hemagglutinin repeat-containing protein n=1 Tax=Campylobacter pinnipediorum TaxID=1965231 RepID=UPI00099594F0|nr:hemagglutinin repeat-containing protein [Campylobacter pinnipediorum]OPA70590.1 hypothetical protein BB381_04335 [Campylobacter pinnipediorum subsp. caledonicus]
MKSSIFFKKIESFLKQNLQKIKKVATVAMAFFLTSMGIRTLAQENKVENIVKDSSKSQKLSIDKNSKNHHITEIQINEPDGKGVSHNYYKKFNMEADGITILNNVDRETAESYESQYLEKPLRQNPNFNRGVGASVIINEITGGSPSNLEGNIEVAGKKADLIFANENGINVNSQKYYNVGKVIFRNSMQDIQNQKEHLHLDGKSITDTIEKIKQIEKQIEKQKDKIEKEKIKDINKNIEEMEKRIKISKKESEIIKSLEKELKKEVKNLEILKASARTANPSMYENKIIIKPSTQEGYSSLYSLQRVNSKTLEIDKKTGAIASKGQDSLSLPVVYSQKLDRAALPTMASTKITQEPSKYVAEAQKLETKSANNTPSINFNKSEDDISLDDASFTGILPVALTSFSPAEKVYKTAKQTKDTQEPIAIKPRSIKIKSDGESANDKNLNSVENILPVALASTSKQLKDTQAQTTQKDKENDNSTKKPLEFKKAEVTTSAAQKLVPVSVSSETNTEKKVDTPIKKLNHIEVADTTKTQLEKVDGNDKSTLVQIAKTNENGISHNLYNEFSIESDENVLLNNNSSGGKVGSKLLNGQQFSSNKNLDGKSASLIINEVGMNDRGATKLAGGLEVLGTKSDVIIANENGIIVNGGRFENVGELTLSSGKYQMSDSSGKQHIFKDNDGKVLVNANTKVDKLSIVDSGQIEISKEATLDSNRLFLQASKNLKNQGKIKGKDARVLSKGNIINDGEINSNDVFVSGKNLINKGKIDSTLSTTVKGRNLENYGEITSKKYVDLTAGTGVNKGKVTSKNVKATLDDYQNEGVLSAKNNLAIYSNDKLINKNEISGNIVQISGDYIENTDGAFISAKDGLKIEGKVLRNDSSAIVSDKQLYIDAQDEIQNVNKALVHSNEAGVVRAKKILNVGSQISSKENLRLQTNELENTGNFNYEIKNEGYKKLSKSTNVRESMWKAWYNGYSVEVKIPKESVNIGNTASLIHSDKNIVISSYDKGRDSKTKVYNKDSSIAAKENLYVLGDLNNLTTTKTRNLETMLNDIKITLNWNTNSLVNGGILNTGKDAEEVSLLKLLKDKDVLRKYQYWNLLRSINDPGLDKLMSIALGSDWKSKDEIPNLLDGEKIEYYSADSRGQVLAEKNIFVKGDVYNDSISTDETLLTWEKNRDTKNKKGIYEKAGEIKNRKYNKYVYSKDAQDSLKKIEKDKEEDTLGKIKAGKDLVVDAEKFNNKNSQIFAGNNLFTSSKDFKNEGSKDIKTDIVAKGKANIQARENVKLELSEIIADEGLDIQARNIDIVGADLYSIGGDVNLEAEEKVNVEDKIETDSEKIIENERTTTTNETTELTREIQSSKASNIKGKNVNIAAGEKAKIKGSNIKAEEKARISAKDVDIQSSKTKDIEKITNQTGGKYKSGLPELAAFKNKDTEKTTQNASKIQAKNVEIEAEKDINVKGSDIVAKENIGLKAGGKINIEDAKEEEKTNESASSMGLVGSTYYKKAEEKGSSRASNIIAGGKVNIQAEEDVDVTGSNIKGSGGDIVSKKKKVNFNAVEETHKVTETETSIGFVGSASAGIGDLGVKAEFDSAHNKSSTEIINNYAPKKGLSSKPGQSKLSSLANGEIGLKISNNKIETEDKKWKNGTLEASEGSFNIKGKEQVDIGGTDIITKKRLDITAEKVESKVYKDTHKEKTTGFSLTGKQSLGATSSILDAMNSSKEITEDAMKGQLNQGLAGLKAAGAVTNLLFNDTIGGNSKQELGFNYTDSNKEVTKDKKSKIKAGEGISITATEEDVNLNNVDIESKGDVDLTAKRDVNVAGGKIEEKSTNNNFSAEIHAQQTAGVSAIFGSNVQAGGGASFDYERGSEESLTHSNSRIKGKNVRINAGRDVNVKGAEIRADKKAKVKAERDLNVESPIDTYNTSKIKSNASATLSAGLGSNTIGAGNVSASAGGGHIYGNGEKISGRSSITAGEEFEAEVGNNLNLDSATIGSDTKKGSLKVDGETKITERVLKEQAGGAIVGISGGITGEIGADVEIGDKKDKQVAQNSIISLEKENISSNKISLNGQKTETDSLRTDKKEEQETLKDVFEKGGSASLSFSVKDTKKLLGSAKPRSKRSTQENGQKSRSDYEDISSAFSSRNEAESKRAQERIDDSSSSESTKEPIYAQIDRSKKTPKVESEADRQARIAQENTQKYGPKESVVSPDNATYMTIQRKGRAEEIANKAQRELPKLPSEDVKARKSLDLETTREKIYEDPYSIISNKNEIENKRVKESDYEDLDKIREFLSPNQKRSQETLSRKAESTKEPIYAQIDRSKKTPKVESEADRQARIAQENTQKYGPKESVVNPDNDLYATIQRRGKAEEIANKAKRELLKLPGEEAKSRKSLEAEVSREKIYEDLDSILPRKNEVEKIQESDYEDLDKIREFLSPNQKRSQETLSRKAESTKEPIYAQIDPSKKKVKVETEAERQARVDQENTQKYGPKESVVSPDNATYMTIQRKGRAEEIANKAQRELPKLPSEDVKTQKSLDVETTREKIYEDPYSIISNKNEIENKRVKESDYEDLDKIRNELKNIKYKMADDVDFGAFKGEVEGKKYKTDDSDFDKSNKFEEISLADEEKAPIANKPKSEYHGLIEGAGSGVTKDNVFNEKYVTINDKIVAITNTNYTPKQLSAEERNRRFDEVKKKAEKLNPHKEAVKKLKKIANDSNNIPKEALISKLNELRDGYNNDQVIELVTKSAQENSKIVVPDTFDVNKLTANEKNEIGKVFNKTPLGDGYKEFRKDVDQKIYENLKENPRFNELMNDNLSGNQEKLKELFKIVSESKKDAFKQIGGIDIPTPKLELLSSSKKHKHIHGDYDGDLVRMNDVAPIPSKEKLAQNKELLNTMIHELTHHDQAYLAENRNNANLRKDLKIDADMFSLNQNLYVQKGENYKKQPLESDAFNAGDSLSDRLIKDVYKDNSSSFGNTDYKPKKISEKEKKKLEKKAKKNKNSEFTDTYTKFRENADTKLLENLSADPQFKKLMSSEINGNPEKVKELVDIVSRAKKNSLEQLGETNIPKSELVLKEAVPNTSKASNKQQQNTEILNNILKQYTYKFSEANGENLVKKISEQKTDKINDGIGNTKYVPEKLSKQEKDKLFKEAKEKAKNRDQAKEAEAKLALLAKNSKNLPKEHLLKAVNEIAYGLGMQDSVELIKKSSETGLKINRPVVIEGFEGKNVKNMGEVLKNIKFDESYIKAREEINKKIVEKLDSSKEFHDLMKEKLSGNEEGIKKLFDMVESAKRESLKEVTGIKGKKATLELNKENGPLSMKQGYYSDNEVHMNATPIISFLRTKKQNNKEILDTIVHELTHHDQAQITGNKNKKLPDAIKADADLLSLNESYYINSDLKNFSAYKNQPLEREAFISGHKLGEQLSKLVDKGYTGDKTEVKEIKNIEHLPNKINNLESPKSAKAELGDNALIYGLKYGRQELIGKANEADKEGKNPTLADSYIGKLNLGFEFANLTDFAKKLNKGEVTDADIDNIANFQDPGAAHARKTESRSRINAANSDDNKKIMTELLKNEKAVDSLKKVGELSEKVDNVFTEMRKNEFLDLDNPKESSRFTDEQNKQIRDYNNLQNELNNARMDFFTEKTKLIAKETLERGGKLYFALDGLATDSTSFTKNTKIDMDRLKDLFDEKNPYYNAVTSRELRYLYENYKDNPNLKFTIKDHVIENPLKTLEIKPSGEEASKKNVQNFEKRFLPELKNPFAKKANTKNEIDGNKQALQSNVSGFGNTDYKPKKISEKEKKKLEKKAKKNKNSEFTDTYTKFRKNADTKLLENLSADPQFKKLMSSEINGNPEKVKELVDIVSRAKKNSLEQLGETNIPKSELVLKEAVPNTSKASNKQQQNTEILNNILKQYTYKFSEANGENLVKKISEQKTDKINDGIGNTKYVPEKLSKQEKDKLFKEAKEKAKNRDQAKEAEAKLALLAKNSKNLPKEHLLKAVNEIAYGLGMQDSVELIKKSSETGLKINRPVVIEGFEGKNVKNMGEVLKNIKFDESYIKAREEINKKIVEKLDSSKEFHDLMKEKLSGNEEGIKKLFDMVESAKRESLKEVTGIKGKKATLELNKENGPLSMKQGYYSDNEVHMNATPIISFLRTKKQNNKEILDTIVHELTHHDQAQITGNKNKKLPDAIKADADLLSLNESYYINSDLKNFSAYKNQPLEREAFISGHKLGEQLSKLVDKGYTGDKTEVKEIKNIEHLPNKINNLESPKSAKAELGDNALIYGLKYGRQELIGKANEADKEGKNPTLADSYIGKLNLGFEFANLTDFAKKLNKGEVTDADIDNIANFQDPGAAHARKTESRSRINAANSDDNKKIMTELLKNEKAVDSLKKVGELSEKVDNVFTEMRKNEFLDLDNPKESSRFTDEQNKQIRDYNNLQNELNNARMDFFTEKTKLIAKETLERGGKLYFALDGLATDSTSFTKNTKIDMDRLKDLFDEKNPYYNAVTSRELRYLYENYKDNPNLKFTIKDHVIENPLKTLEIKPSK